jgi:hypothetical protein
MKYFTWHRRIVFSGLCYKIIKTIASDDRKLTLCYKLFTTIVSALPLALAIVVIYDQK